LAKAPTIGKGIFPNDDQRRRENDDFDFVTVPECFVSDTNKTLLETQVHKRSKKMKHAVCNLTNSRWNSDTRWRTEATHYRSLTLQKTVGHWASSKANGSDLGVPKS
jgi:hypothetical protein